VRHTKIVATTGPASSRRDLLNDLIAAGVDIFRLNFSHGSRDSHAAMADAIRRAAREADRVVAIMQDLAGPKIRTGRLDGGGTLRLREGDVLKIGIGEFPGRPGLVSTTYAELARSARPGDRLLLDDGRIELQVEAADGETITTRVTNGGELGEHKGINAPGVALPASAMTPKDVDDLHFGLDLGVDFVAVSFVQSASDIERTREVMTAAGRSAPIIAKIERPQAVENIDTILDTADGVMVARGDLGLELPLERVPRIQKQIVVHARLRGVPVIVATQVLESMRTEPRPTRAEVSDAANAVDEGVDAIMLAGETAAGAFPVRAVETLDAVIRDAEAMPSGLTLPLNLEVPGALHSRAICESAVTLADAAGAHAIVAITRAGKTARMLAALRPTAPIYALTDNDAVARRLALLWGVTPLVSEIGGDADTARLRAEQKLVAHGAVSEGALVVFVSVNPDLSRTDANFLSLRRLAS
jgi:pyruvate kinase